MPPSQTHTLSQARNIVKGFTCVFSLLCVCVHSIALHTILHSPSLPLCCVSYLGVLAHSRRVLLAFPDKMEIY